MRVAMVMQSFAPVLGGAQRQVEQLGPLLERHGVEATVVTRRWTHSPVRERRPGLRVVRVPASGDGAAGSLAYTGGGSAAVVAMRPDVVHAHDLLSPSTIALAANAALGVPVVAKILSTGPFGDVTRLLTKPFGRHRLRLIAERFAGFVCLSAEVERELREHGVPEERLLRIPNGVDTTRFRPALDGECRDLRASFGVPADEPLTVYCGRLRPPKRLDVLLEAFRSVPGHLLVVGEGSEEERLRELASTPGLAGRVTLHPKVDDPAPVYRAADVYASASHTEGMSGSILEAMATGLPVAAAPASGMAELVRDDTGVLADDPSSEALAVALNHLLEDRERRMRLGERARDTVASGYSLAATADLLAGLYARLRAERTG